MGIEKIDDRLKPLRSAVGAGNPVWGARPKFKSNTVGAMGASCGVGESARWHREQCSTGCYESFVEDPARQCSREGSTSLSRESVYASAETETSAVRSMAVVMM